LLCSTTLSSPAAERGQLQLNFKRDFPAGINANALTKQFSPQKIYLIFGETQTTPFWQSLHVQKI